MATPVTAVRRTVMKNKQTQQTWIIAAIVGGGLFLMIAGGLVVIGAVLLSRAKTPTTQVQPEAQQPQVEQVTPPQQAAAKVKKIYTREEIELLVKGRTEKQALEVLGMPSNTSKNGPMVLWVYAEVSRDAVTNKIDSSVAIEFENGYVKKIYFRN